MAYQPPIAILDIVNLPDPLPAISGNSLKALRVNAGETAYELYIPDVGDMLKSQNLSGLANYTTARSNLGLGTLATQSATITDYLLVATAASTYQPLDADLTTIAGLTATTDNFIVSVASAWASRTPAQVKTTLSLSNVDNTSDANKPVSDATQTALNLKANLASPTFTTPVLGVATITSLNKVTITAPAASAVLTIADGVTLTVSANTTLSGTPLSNPMTTLGDTVYGGVAGVATRLAGDTNNVRKFIRTLSVAGTATAPVWDTLLAADVPTLNQNTTGNAATVTTNANLTGHVTSTGNAAVLGSFTFAQLNTAVSDADLARTNDTNTFTGVQTFSSAPVFSAGIPNANLPNGIRASNSAEQSQIVVSATNYYITNSGLTMPAAAKAGMIVGTKFVWDVFMTKTAAGTGIFQISIYRGTNGSTGDTQDVLQTIGTQTAAVDSMIVRVTVYVTTTGASGAYFWTITPINKAITATGFGVATGTTGYFSGTVSAVAMNTASLIFGLGFKATTGTPTIRVVSVDGQAYNMD